MQAPAIKFDPALAEALSRPAPRYTSYPTAVHFTGDFTREDHARAIAASNAVGRPLSLYLHIPFCAKLCHYCGCHMLVTERPERVSRYAAALEREIDLVASRLGPGRQVVQVHLGGGTPNSFLPAEIEHLMRRLYSWFDVAPQAEVSFEADPRTLTAQHIAAAARAGFNRVSFGVQTFDPVVQEAIGRVQPLEVVAQAAARARYEGIGAVAFDLLYGLPHQTLETFARTLEHVVALAPDRVALFGYAHVPWMKKHQRLIDESALPGPAARLELFALAHERLTIAGYVPVGMDHFARPGDSLARATEHGSLHRNFQGYTTRAGVADVVGLGISAISDLGGAYAQNAKGLRAYYDAVESGLLPTERGVTLTPEDRLRRHVIQELMCRFTVAKRGVEELFEIDFDEHFAPAIDALEPLTELGVVTVTPQAVDVTARGRPFVRNVAAAFDAYIEAQPPERRYSTSV